MNDGAPTTDQTAVRASGVRRVYPGGRRSAPRVALDSVDLEVERGQWVALLGPNGAGKSTLLRIIATLDRQDSGGVRVLGHDLPGNGGPVREGLGVVFQSPSLDALLTVRENLELQGALHGIDAPDCEERIGELGERLGFVDRMRDRVGSLSGGLVRRVDLARALLSEPELLLLDEATAGLDIAARGRFFEQLGSVRGERAMSVVMSTHHVDEAERCDRVVMMNDGRVVADEVLEDLRRTISGERTLETSLQGIDVLRGAGHEAVERSGHVIMHGSAEEVGRAAALLIERGVAARVGATSLADLFLEKTGAVLDEDEGVAG